MAAYTVAPEVGDDERIDRIAARIYGTERGGTVELLLDANPGLAALGPFIPRGTVIEVPQKPAPPPNPAYQRPWE